MINKQFIEDLSLKIRELVKDSPATDMEKNFRALLQGVFTKLELVSREEFDIQVDVLRHAREKLDLLQAKLTKLESMLRKSDKK